MDDYELAELRTDLALLRERVDVLEGTVGSSVQDDIQDVGDGVAELTRQLTQLTQQVEGLDRRVRTGGAADACDLDDVGERLTALARQAETARKLTATLLDDAERQQLRYQLQRYQTWREQQDRLRATALDASGTLADTAMDQTEHEDAARAFQAAQTRLADLAEQYQQLRNAAQDAQHRIDEDDARRRQRARALNAGAAAWTTLLAEIRDLIGNAVNRGKLLPVWFTTALGGTPTPDAGGWADTAAKLVAYRMTYQVIDPLVALGPEPTDDAPAHQRAWYRQLDTELRQRR